jgi:hypothetical protein
VQRQAGRGKRGDDGSTLMVHAVVSSCGCQRGVRLLRADLSL